MLYTASATALRGGKESRYENADDSSSILQFRAADRCRISPSAVAAATRQSSAGDAQKHDALAKCFMIQAAGQRPDIRLVLAALKSCRSSKDLKNGRKIHEAVVESMDNIYLANSLLDLYAKCGSMPEAQKVFDKMQLRSVVSWTSMIQGYVQIGEERLALELYERMIEENCVPDAVTFVAALKACCGLAGKESGKLVHGNVLKMDCLERGKVLHFQAAERGHGSDLFLQNTLIDMYAKCGSLVEARRVFDAMKLHDVVSWNCIMRASADNGEGEVGLQLFARMQAEGCVPNRVTNLAALKACAAMAEKEDWKKAECLAIGRSIHSKAVKGGGEILDLALANALVDMYGKCGSLADARHVFQRSQSPNVVSWNCIILACARNGEGNLALQFYRRMQEEGCEIDDVTLLGALKACAVLAEDEEEDADKSRCLEETKSIHAEAMRVGKELELFVASTLVDVYSKCGNLMVACQVFEKMQQRSVISWNCIILSHAECGLGNEALHFYKRMQDEGCKADSGTFVAALKACSNLAETEEEKFKRKWLATCRRVHSQVSASGLDFDIFVANTLVDTYAKSESPVDAYIVFDSMQQRSSVSWNCIILSCALCGDAEVALDLYGDMRDDGFEPDAATLVAVLKACSILAEKEDGKLFQGKLVKSASLRKVKGIHAQAVRGKHNLESNVESSFIDVYVKCGSLWEAQRVFESRDATDVYAWTALTLGYAQIGESERALQLFAQMEDEGCRPDALTFVAVLQACGNLASLDTGRRIHDRICSFQLQSDEFVANALVSFYGKCGSMVYAQQVFDELSTKNLVTWSALISGYSCQGNTERVFGLFEKLKEDELKPDGVIFLLILNACSYGGLVDKGKEYFREMIEEHGIAPSVEHYTSMVDMLGRANQLDDAVAMLKSLPVEPGVTLWMVLLGACWKWKNVEVGRHAFESVLKLDSINASAYVLMSNIYAVSDMWDEARQLRAQVFFNRIERNGLPV